MPDHQIFAANEPFPAPVPDREGGVLMEIGFRVPWGIFCQYPGMSKKELAAFKGPLLACSHFETPTAVPIAFWTFKFSNGILFETNFNARECLKKAENQKTLFDFLEKEDGQYKNALQFFFLDGQILKAMKTFGMPTDLLEMFHKTIRKQLSLGYQKEEYLLTLQGFRNLSIQEIFDCGVVWEAR